LSELLAGRHITLVHDTVTQLDPDRRVLSSAGAKYHYDQLVLALGSVTNYFGIQGLEQFSYDIKSITGAERFKQHLHKELIDDRKPDLNYVVVGGGPTGVELAAALGDYLRRITRLHGLGHPRYRIELVEAAPRLLPRLPEAFSARVQRQLEALGVQVMTGAVVQAETAGALQLAGQSIATKTVVWTAGVANNPFFKANAALFKFAKNGKIEVDEHLQPSPHIYIIGDNASTQYSGMAQTAIADANFAADDIIHLYHNYPRVRYRPAAPVSVIPVGERWAAAQWGRFTFYGYPGFILRRLADLVGYADVESWSQALRVWLKDSRREDNCSICSPDQAASSAPVQV
jgi:NADH dehydrogenase